MLKVVPKFEKVVLKTLCLNKLCLGFWYYASVLMIFGICFRKPVDYLLQIMHYNVKCKIVGLCQIIDPATICI